MKRPSTGSLAFAPRVSLASGTAPPLASVTLIPAAESADDDTVEDESELAGPNLLGADDDEGARAKGGEGEDADDASVQSADVIPLRATEDEQ